MAEIRFQVEDDLHEALTRFKKLAGLSSLGDAARSLITVYVNPSISAIEHQQQAIAASPKAAPSPPIAAPVVGGFGASLQLHKQA